MNQLAEEIFRSALKAVDPAALMVKEASHIEKRYRLGRFKRLIVAGAGKASCSMAKGVEDALGGLVDCGIVVTKYGHSIPLKKIDVFEAGHPVPDDNGIRATERIISLLSEADEKTLIVFLISGGCSSLLIAPTEGISLKDKRATTELLLKAGADIVDVNIVRKRLSKVKGGGLLRYSYPAHIESFILSDVVGDRLDTIGSAPTHFDDSTRDDALHVFEKYGLTGRIPAAVIRYLRSGEKLENCLTGEELVANKVIGNNDTSVRAAMKEAERLGLMADRAFPEPVTGEARDAGKRLGLLALLMKRTGQHGCLVSGGETTVTVKGKGLGGRNMELALAFAVTVEGCSGITLLSAGTDGTDGPTNAAGAIVDGETAKTARAKSLKPWLYLRRNDSYNFFRQTGNLFVTGPTGTNVMDLQIMIVEPQ